MTDIWDEFVPAEERRRLSAAGFGAPVRLGERPCLLVIDMVLSFMGRRPGDEEGIDYQTGCGPEAWARLPAVLRVLDAARAAGIPRVLTKGSPQAAMRVGGAVKLSQDPQAARRIHEASFPAELVPRSDELVLEKTKASAFFSTPLLTYLHQQRVDSLIVTGTTTSGCVRASVVDGFSHGYGVLVVEDACFDRSRFQHIANLFDIEMKYGSVVTSDEILKELASRRAA